MKKMLSVLLMSMALSAQAEFVETTAAVVDNNVSTVAVAKTMPDDSRVVLEGYITSKVGTLNPEEYFFKDHTDMIKVEIDHDKWRNQTVTPQTKVRLYGEVDKNRWNKTVEIEVDYLEIIQ